jgi:cyclopropane-fatty-acyl-phospholipid synthase
MGRIDALVAAAIEGAERGWIPDAALRAGIRRLLQRRLDQGGDPRGAAALARKQALLHELRSAPLAVAADAANAQHYEVPAAFFRRVLGPRLKYSCCHFGDGEGGDGLAEAEERMLALSCRRAGLEDGMRVLDLGCGWGSLALWIAERYPRCRVLAVSNSKSQREHILGARQRRGLSGVEVATADVRSFDPGEALGGGGGFDRVISVEMFEHVRNWELLLRRIAGWLAPGGRLFVHVFCHRDLAYPFEDRARDDWMARHFFTGGLMPSEDLLLRMQRDLLVEEQWRIDGVHYQRTALAWLANLDRERKSLLELFAALYPEGDAARRLQRWRIFFLACAELFGFRGGSEWSVVHARLAPREALR